MGDLPAEAIRIGKVAAVPAPGLPLGWMNDVGPGVSRVRYHRVDLLGAAHVVTQRHGWDAAGGLQIGNIHPELGRHGVAVPEGEDETVVDLDEDDLSGHLVVGLPAQT